MKKFFERKNTLLSLSPAILTTIIIFNIPILSHAAPNLPFSLESKLIPVPRMSQSTQDNSIPSNSVIDLELFDLFVWAATGEGLGRFEPFDMQGNPAAGDWFSITVEDGFGNGGVSGLAIGNPTFGGMVVWAATAIDTTAQGTDYAAGGGVGYSLDDGTSWTWMPQPVDPRDAQDMSPTTVSIQNVTYDIAILEDRVWIASWAGGLRYLDMTQDGLIAGGDSLEWINQPPDTNEFHAVDHLNHRAFSITTMDTLLWVGTAGGINLSKDRGSTWARFGFSPNNEATLTGNFVPALGAQITSTGKSIIWAASWAAEGAGEFYGVSKSEDLGNTWQRVLGSPEEPMRVHNFTFDDTVVYVASDNGLFRSFDYGENWGPEGLPAPFPAIYDIDSLRGTYEPDVYSVAIGFNKLWVGSPEGLGVSQDGGLNWRLMRTFSIPGAGGTPSTYAYPNPFSPERFAVVRFQYHMRNPGTVTLEIYDFAMELLIRPIDQVWRPAGNRNEVWDGLAPGGRKVANGVYFYRIDGGGEERWGKVLVLD
ncbi:MAG: hypothetical protein P9L92_16275 [Candidatus Electryonea clarkiae]|nr:hypothetical protein [Candidatus Electryonea clarkiae]MDP8288589.1 hypothetical protein [Candidatus Electryonea clarkiae]